MTREEAIRWFEGEKEAAERQVVAFESCFKCFKSAHRKIVSYNEMAIAALREQEERSKAESEGRVIVLPCKVGDTIYQLRNKKHSRGLGVSPRIVSSACVWTDGSYALCHQGMTYCQSRDLGKTWFLTQGEAEEALRRLEEV